MISSSCGENDIGSMDIDVTHNTFPVTLAMSAVDTNVGGYDTAGLQWPEIFGSIKIVQDRVDRATES